MKEIYNKVLEKIKEADSIIIGASNGLSISEGYHIFAYNEEFIKNFGDFEARYGFHSIIQGCFYNYPSVEEKWAFFSRLYEYFLGNNEASSVLKNLYELVRGKNYFVITSNGDNHLELAGFSSECLFEIEGNCRNIQCAHGCHNKIYPGDAILSKMAKSQENGKVPQNIIPKCPECGGDMQVHFEVDSNFVRDKSWQNKYNAYQDFIKKSHGKKLVLLELGVGARNQMIKAPFMKLTNFEEHATYITFNKGELYIPEIIADKSIGIDGDISEILETLVDMKE